MIGGALLAQGKQISTRQDLDFVSAELLEKTAEGEIIEGFPRFANISAKLNSAEGITAAVPSTAEIKTAKSAVPIDYPDLFGGKDMNGGAGGSILLTLGEWNQTLHDRTRQRILSEDNGFPKEWRDKGVPAPTFRGVATAHLSGDPGFWFGKNDPNMPTTTWRVMRRPRAPFWMPADENWHPTERETLVITPVANDDAWRFPAANPAAVIYELMTDPDIGAGYAADEMDLDAYIHAARILSREKLGISGQWTLSGPVKEFVKKICEVIDGVTFTDPVTGLRTIRLLRPDESLMLLPVTGTYPEGSRWHYQRFTQRRPDVVLHEGNASVAEANRASYAETVTHFHVKYTNDVTEEEGGVVEVDEAALGRKLGISKTEERDAKFVRSPVIARRIARREMRNKTKPPLTAKLRVGPTTRALRPYDVITLAFTDGSVPPGEYRVVKVPYGGTDGESLMLDVVDDVFSGKTVLGPDKPNVVWSGGSTALVLSANGPYVTFPGARTLRETGMTPAQVRALDSVVVSHLLSSPTPTSFWRATQRDGGAGEDWDALPGADIDPVSSAQLVRRYPPADVTTFLPGDLEFDRNAGSGLVPGSRILFVRPLRLTTDPWTLLRPAGSGAAAQGYSMSSLGAPQDAVAGAAMAMDTARKDEGEIGWQYREEMCVITAVGEDRSITVTRGLYGTTPAPLPKGTVAYLLPDKDEMYSVREAEEGFQVSGRYTPVNAAGRGVLTIESSGVAAEPRHDFPERPGRVSISDAEATAGLGQALALDAPADITITWRRRDAFLNRPSGFSAAWR